MRGLVHDTLRLILSIGGVVLVLVLAGKLFSVYLHNQDTEIAKKTLDSLVEKALLVQENQTGKFPLRGPDEWYLLGWGTALPPSQRPERCYLESCVCICKGFKKENCQDLSTGVCKDVPGITSIVHAGRPLSAEEQRLADLAKLAKKDESIRASADASAPAFKPIPFPANYIEIKVTRTGKTLTFGVGG